MKRKRFDMKESLDYICRLERGLVIPDNKEIEKMISLLRQEFEHIVTLELEVSELQGKLYTTENKK